jgi:hypothetical protein
MRPRKKKTDNQGNGRRSVNEETTDGVKLAEEKIETCAHCGAENPPGLLLCLECERDPLSGRDLFAPPEVPMPGEIPIPDQLPPVPDLTVNMPDSIQVPDAFIPVYDELTVTLPDPILIPDPLPIPSLEDFAAPPTQPPLVPPPQYIAPPPEPKDLAPVLNPGPRWTVGLVGLVLVSLLGLAAVASFASLNLPGGVCLGSLWLVAAVLWLGLISLRRGESRSTATGARRRLVISLGRRLFEITPSATKEQLAQLPIVRVPPLTQPASHLLYLNSSGDRTSQLIQVLLGTTCALVAGDHVELANQTYDVVTASPLRRNQEKVKRTAVTVRTLYVGVGYLEKVILQQLRRTSTPSVRDLAADVLRQAGADLLDRVAADVGQAPPLQDAEAPDLDAQVTALREFCQEFEALNPELYEQLSAEVEDAVRSFLRTSRQASE